MILIQTAFYCQMSRIMSDTAKVNRKLPRSSQGTDIFTSKNRKNNRRVGQQQNLSDSKPDPMDVVLYPAPTTHNNTHGTTVPSKQIPIIFTLSICHSDILTPYHTYPKVFAIQTHLTPYHTYPKNCPFGKNKKLVCLPSPYLPAQRKLPPQKFLLEF